MVFAVVVVVFVSFVVIVVVVVGDFSREEVGGCVATWGAVGVVEDESSASEYGFC